MTLAQLIPTLSRNDARRIGRDRFLLLMIALVIYLAVILRFGLPWLDGYLADNGILPGEMITQRLSDYYPLIVAFMGVFQGALITGTLFGFALLDEKDDQTLTAMLVTPVPFNQYILYRVAVPTILSAFIVVFLVWFINQALIPLWQLILIALGAALAAPISALFYGISSENKVQGLAMSKFVSLFGYIIVGAWFVDEPWQWLFGLFPPYWITKAYWLALEGRSLWVGTLLLGVVLQAGLIVWLVGRFKRVAYRG